MSVKRLKQFQRFSILQNLNHAKREPKLWEAKNGGGAQSFEDRVHILQGAD